MAQADVKPTRSELLAIKKKIVVSRKGHKILKMKMEGLILNFFEIMESAKSMRSQLSAKYERARQDIAVAAAVEGAISVKSAAFALNRHPEIGLEQKNVMGVVVPIIKADRVRNRIDERGYGLIGTSPYINDAAKSFEDLVEDVIKAAELETTMKKLVTEIERTKRRVNALEYKIIPGLEAGERFIEMRLEEMERENTFRLKRIKNKSGGGQHGSTD
jgi:V/A-type H+-transporting ATPase subunit D